jgi:5-methylthioadenosine/S-adenosylhomocysteine deaminase
MRLVADYVVPCEGAGRVIAGGAIDIGSDGRISAIGRAGDLGPEAGVEVVRVGGLLMPGLVNAHAHTPMTLIRSVGDGLPLQRWLKEAVWPLEAKLTADDAHLGMTLGSVEMLLAGVTTSCEMYLFEEAIVDAVSTTGARLVMTPGVIAALSPDGNVEPRIEQITAFHTSHHRPDERINVGFAPHSIYDLTPAQCGEIGARAQAVGALFHIHLEETRHERQQVIEAHGASATQLLADHGVLEGPVLAAHGVWLDSTDRRLLAEAGAAVAHCPQSNLKLGSGIAPVVELLEAGVTVGVGTDGPASNDNLDLWEELRLAPLLARGSNHDPQAMAAARALSLATRDSARALQLADVGHLAVGAWADVIRLELDVPAFRPLREENLLTQLVFAGSSRFVTDVWVAGRPIVAQGQLLTVDVEALLAQCQARCRALSS